jgi:3-isopropylmalate/(R)-2-methylmalate dehydratase small subunit
VILPDAACATLRSQLHANPGATVAVDLEAQKVTGPDGAVYPFDIDANAKERLLKGLDDIGLVMQYSKDIEAFEQRHAAALPWLA